MAWPETTLNGWDHFLKMVSALTVGSPSITSYLFRGQADANWPLKPTLLRYIKPDVSTEEAITIEKDALREFRSHAHLHLPSNILSSTSNLLHWWSLMQHYNAPTRLLDWTKSPYVAAYFVVEQLWDRDGAIWLFHAKDLRNEMNSRFEDIYTKQEPEFKKYLLNPKADQSLQPWLPNVLSDRMVAQQGCFTISPCVLGNHETIIDEACNKLQSSGIGEVYRKVIIQKEMKPEFLRNLRAMNITANSLFPGIDGLGRSVTELTRLTFFYPREENRK
jgi:hypothetical protein